MKWSGFHLIVLIIFLSISISNVSANSECMDEKSILMVNKPENSPDRYCAEITLLDASNISTRAGSYDLKFVVELWSPDVNFIEDGVPIIDFENSKSLQVKSYRNGEEKIEDHYYSVEVNDIFYNTLDFHLYPYGPIDVAIDLEIEDNGTSKAVFIKKPLKEPNDHAKHIPGWNLKNWNSTITEVKDANENNNSRFTMTYYFEKPLLSNFLILFFPVLVVLGIVLFNFHQDPYDGLGHKAALASILVLVFFQSSFLKSEIPPLEYLTLQDKFMTISYLVVIYPIIGVLLQRKYNIQDDLKMKIKLNRKMFKILPIIVILTFLLLESVDLIF